MNIRLRTKKLIIAGVIGASAMLLLSVIVGYVFYKKSNEKELQLREQYHAELSELKHTVEQTEEGWALNAPVERGDLITEDMIKKVSLPTAASSEDAITAVAINTTRYYAKTDLVPNTVLVEAMVDKEEPLANDLREGEYSFIELPTKLSNEDYIDVRIQFPNGDDYILLSKKKVKQNEGLTVWFDMDEGDQLMMSSAIVDAFVEEGKIYAMPYIDGPMQESAEITYPAKANVLQLIEDSPNIVHRAKLNLEAQNRQRLESSLSEMGEDKRQKLRTQQKASEEIRKSDDKERELNALNQLSQQEAEEEILDDPYEEEEGK